MAEVRDAVAARRVVGPAWVFLLALVGLNAHPMICRAVCPYDAEVVSVSTAGEPGNSYSVWPSLSADGRFVAFASYATNLVPNDTNGLLDVFVRDRSAGTTEIVSVSTSGDQGNDEPYYPCISSDGRFVAFASRATNLVADDTNGFTDIFVHDRLTGTTERVSVSSDGQQADASVASPSISGDGRFVAFASPATNLVANDTNGLLDIFVRDRSAGTTEIVSVSTSGEQGNGVSSYPCISSDGRFVAFTSEASNLVPEDTKGFRDVFVHDRQTRQTSRVSVASDGSEANGSSYGPAVSGNGRYVAFWSGATNLAEHSSGWVSLLLVDRATGRALKVSERYLYAPWGWNFALSADGRHVAQDGYWETGYPPEQPVPHWSIVVHDIEHGRWLFQECEGANSPALSSDARYVAFSEGLPGVTSDVVIWDTTDRTPAWSRVTSGPCGHTLCRAEGAVCWSGGDNETPVESLEYSWRIDGAAWHGPTSDTCTTLTGLADGAHIFEVKARDLSGNEDPTPARCEFTVDATPPVVSITSPANGSAVRGTVTITAAVSEAVVTPASRWHAAGTAALQAGIERVEFYVNGELLCTDTEPPYTCDWDTMAVGRAFLRPPSAGGGAPALHQNGPAQICVKAFDSCGRSAQKCITVTVRNQTFEDVPPEHPAWLAIETIAARGITSGCSLDPRLFCPYANITRAQLAAFICRAAGKAPLDRATPTFADVPKTHWAYGYIERFCDAESWNGNALQPRRVGASGSPQGAAPGYACSVFPSKRFCPGASVTREQIAWILCAATGKQPTASCSGLFADVPSSNPLCRWIERLADATSWPGSKPVTSGCACPSTSLPSSAGWRIRAGGATPSGYPPAAKCYCPKSNVTRGQMAVFLVRAFGIPL